MEGAPSKHMEICHDKEENENHNNVILSTPWGSVFAWREQMLVVGSEFALSKRHLKALPYKSSTIDYDKLTICFGKDVVTGQYARSATTAPSHQSTESGAANFSPLQADSDVGFTDRLGGLTTAIRDIANTTRLPKRKHSSLILTELRGIHELSGLDVELAHEWLIVHADMATVFITADKKGDWIMRQMPMIRQERM
ncbi:hypothetical protein MRB53_024313 [Persea americana]|uniref:Uncharacterized protein n=1 Tax=Persea americana TaxID=3435 RepID=A0ACC2LC17_PERAE|nr:hypothetical protein MRB53_024313 [Persea americana]